MKVNIVYYKNQVRGLGLEATRPTMNHDARQGYRFTNVTGDDYDGSEWLLVTREQRAGRLAIHQSNIAALDVDAAEEATKEGSNEAPPSLEEVAKAKHLGLRRAKKPLA